MKTYNELSKDLKKEARKLHPYNFKKWFYMVQGVEIYFSAK